jgi:hypothetical protein
LAVKAIKPFLLFWIVSSQHFPTLKMEKVNCFNILKILCLNFSLLRNTLKAKLTVQKKLKITTSFGRQAFTLTPFRFLIIFIKTIYPIIIKSCCDHIQPWTILVSDISFLNFVVHYISLYLITYCERGEGEFCELDCIGQSSLEAAVIHLPCEQV